MKAGEYISLFGLLHTYPIQWKGGYLHELVYYETDDIDLDKIELDERDLDVLYQTEFGSLNHIIKNFTDEREIISFLRELFDEYRNEGGSPEYWLCALLNEMELNPHIFPTIHRGVIERNLLQWLDNWRTILREGQPPTSNRAAKMPADNIEDKPKHIPSKREREALFLYYTEGKVKRSHPLYQLVNRWNNEDYRRQSNHNAKTYNTKKDHLQAVKMRVLSEKPKGWEKTANEIQTDIETLTINYKKKVPG